MNNWYVITGGPSTGKTTLLSELKTRGYTTVPEAARAVIDQALSAGSTIEQLRADEKKFQEIILDHKLKIENSHPAELLTFFDRGMHDTLAYLRLKSHNIEEHVIKAVRNSTYKLVFLLDPLDVYVADYARTETQGEACELNNLIYEAFAEYGMDPVRVPFLPPESRADFVLQHIR